MLELITVMGEGFVPLSSSIFTYPLPLEVQLMFLALPCSVAIPPVGEVSVRFSMVNDSLILEKDGLVRVEIFTL